MVIPRIGAVMADDAERPRVENVGVDKGGFTQALYGAALRNAATAGEAFCPLTTSSPHATSRRVLGEPARVSSDDKVGDACVKSGDRVQV